jgi:hypothetical protein
MEDDLITTKEVGDYRIKVYYCRDSECPITNWGLFGSFFFEYLDIHRLHDECNWKTFFYDNKHNLRDVIDAIVMKHIEQKDIVKYLKKGEVDDEIIYNGNIEDVKEEWMRAIQNGVDKMNVNKDMNGHNLIYVIKYGICRYAYRICIDSYPGYVVKDPITLIEWIQGLKPGTVIKIRGIFIYHFL